MEINPDLALLQEVSSIPESIEQAFATSLEPAAGKAQKPRRFKTGILVRGRIEGRLALSSSKPWVASELERFKGNLPAFDVQLASGPRLRVVSVYSPAWPVARERYKGIDVSGVRLALSRDVWVTDLLWDALRSVNFNVEDWIVGGDFNSCETFDDWKGGPRGNREFLDRMAALGLTECLRQAQGRLTPTFRNTDGGAVKVQIDHVFTSPRLAADLLDCRAGSIEDVFGRSLSDHLPVIADFRQSPSASVD
jgi:endonuclease/exonuclease/phosphatase (EEP) superfamily protein YafD